MSSEFKDIYNLWSRIHDENTAIIRHKKSFEEEKTVVPTISELRKMNTQAKLDLHNLTLEEALSRANFFIEDCWSNGLRKIKIVTGKGLHSPNGEPVIRPEIINIISRHSKVREYNIKPKASEGGSGVIVIILREN